MVDELMIFWDDFLFLKLHCQLDWLLNVMRMNDHRGTMRWDCWFCLNYRELLLPILAILFHWTDRWGLDVSFTRDLSWFLWLCWIDELMGGLKEKVLN